MNKWGSSIFCSGGLVVSLFLSVSKLGNPRSKLDGAFRERGALPQTQPPSGDPQEDLLAFASGEQHVGLLPNGKTSKEGDHIFVQEGKSRLTPVIRDAPIISTQISVGDAVQIQLHFSDEAFPATGVEADPVPAIPTKLFIGANAHEQHASLASVFAEGFIRTFY